MKLENEIIKQRLDEYNLLAILANASDRLKLALYLEAEDSIEIAEVHYHEMLIYVHGIAFSRYPFDLFDEAINNYLEQL